MKRHTGIVLALVLVALGAGVAWIVRPQPVIAETAPVTKGMFEQTIVEEGKTRVLDRYVVSAPLAARVARIALKAGDRVNEGEVVAVLTPTMPTFLDARARGEMTERVGATEAQRLRAHAEVQRAQAHLKQVVADRERMGKLAREGFVSDAAREQAELAVVTAERSVDAAIFAEHAAQHDEAQANAALAHYRAEASGKPSRLLQWEIRSPITGAILKVVQESEGVVALGAPLVEIANPRTVEAVIDVLSQDSINLVPGMEAQVELGPEAPLLAARVRQVEPAAFTKVSALGIEEQRVNVILDFTEPLERVQTIGDGFRVNAKIVTFKVTDAVKVPVAALFRSGTQWAVFVVADHRARQRPVRVSRRNAAEAIVVDGVVPGDAVVIYPSPAIHDRARIIAESR